MGGIILHFAQVIVNSDIILEEMQRVVDKAKLNKDVGVDNS